MDRDTIKAILGAAALLMLFCIGLYLFTESKGLAAVYYACCAIVFWASAPTKRRTG